MKLEVIVIPDPFLQKTKNFKSSKEVKAFLIAFARVNNYPYKYVLYVYVKSILKNHIFFELKNNINIKLLIEALKWAITKESKDNEYPYFTLLLETIIQATIQYYQKEDGVLLGVKSSNYVKVLKKICDIINKSS